MPPLVASIPSPSDATIGIGPLSVHVYGLLIALGVVVAVRTTMVRWERRGGRPEDILDGALVVVLAGVVGARAYHVGTDYQRFDHGDWPEAFAIWRGGLAIWGAVLGGAVAVAVLTRRKGVRALAVSDCVVPGLFFAQAIGRWGNWFNQELFGRPTGLPWALEISPEHRPSGYAAYATFHPTFLYESLYCLLGGVVLLQIDKRLHLRRGQLTALYVVGYTFGRFFLENLRIDDAHRLLGLRVNAWVSVALFGFGLGWFLWLGRHGEPADAPLVREPTPEPSP
ncbi:MAG: prolipoprotein diacylglyceryl transferase [Actinomycetota bacterium]